MARLDKHPVSEIELNIADYWHRRLAGACKQMQINRAALVVQDIEQTISVSYANMPPLHGEVKKQYAVLCLAKLFTSTLIALLVMQRKLAFSALANDLLPGAPGTELLQGIRVAHLLSHTHGLGCNGLSLAPADSAGFIDIASVISSLQTGGRVFAPGKFFSYGAAGYVLLGSIIEHVTQKPFKDFLQEEILSRLSLQRYQTYHADYLGNVTSICPSSGQGLNLSMDDMVAFAGSFAGCAAGGLDLQQALVDEIFAAQQPLPGWSPVFSGCCYGWKNFNNDWYGHNGIANGQLMYVRINRTRQTVICLAAESAERSPGALPSLLFRTAYPALCFSNAMQPRFINEPAPDGSDAVIGSFGRGYLSFHIALQYNKLTVEIMTTVSGHTIAAHHCYLRAAQEHIYFLEKPWQNITFLQLVTDENGRRYLWDHTQLWPEVMMRDI